MEYEVSSVLALISRIHSLAVDFLQQQLSQLGLPDFATSHGFILYSLSQKEQLTLGELADTINRDKSTTTVLVRKLAAANLVAIAKDASDSRKKLITLTDCGRAYNDRTAQISRELLCTSYRGFSDDEKQLLKDLLVRLSENIDQSHHEQKE